MQWEKHVLSMNQEYMQEECTEWEACFMCHRSWKSGIEREENCKTVTILNAIIMEKGYCPLRRGIPTKKRQVAKWTHCTWWWSGWSSHSEAWLLSRVQFWFEKYWPSQVSLQMDSEQKAWLSLQALWNYQSQVSQTVHPTLMESSKHKFPIVSVLPLQNTSNINAMHLCNPADCNVVMLLSVMLQTLI